MLKCWCLAFNPDTDFFHLRHLWVLLPGIPLHFWNEEAFRVIGNSLGKCISLDSSSRTGSSRRMGMILVEIDISTGLPETLEIEWRGRKIIQKLDYLRIPFRCNLYRETGHLRQSCLGKNSNTLLDDSYDLLLNPPAYQSANPSLAFLDVTPDPFTSSPPELSDSLSKLSHLCPTLYKTLTDSENLWINNFDWIAPSSHPEPLISEADQSRHTLSSSHHDCSLPSPLTSSPSLLVTLNPSSLPSTQEGSSPFPTAILDHNPLPGYNQPVEDETPLLDALNTTSLALFTPDIATEIPLFRGKETIAPSIEVGLSTLQHPVSQTKSFAWSRGLGIELSPL